jgi:hypothetical protein
MAIPVPKFPVDPKAYILIPQASHFSFAFFQHWVAMCLFKSTNHPVS